MIPTPFSLMLVFLLPLLAWKITQLRRDPSNFGLRALTVTLAFITMLSLSTVPFDFPVLFRFFPSNVARVAAELCIIASTAAIHFFYLEAVSAERRATRVRVDVVLLACVVVAMVVLGATAPLPAGLELSVASAHHASVVSFYLISAVYLTYLLVMQLRWWGELAARKALPRFMRVAAAVLVLGACLGFACTWTRIGVIAYTLATGILVFEAVVIAALLGIAAFVLTGVGLGLPILRRRVRRAASWARQLHTWKTLGPLWQTVRAAYPELIRPARPGSVGGVAAEAVSPGDRDCESTEINEERRYSWGDAPPRRSRVRFAFQLRLQQCRDGRTRASAALAAGQAPADDSEQRLLAAVRLNEHDEEHPGTTDALVRLSRDLRRGRADTTAAASEPGELVDDTPPAGYAQAS